MRTILVKWTCDRCGDTETTCDTFPEKWDFPGETQICPRCAQGDTNPWDTVQVGDPAPSPFGASICGHVLYDQTQQPCPCVRSKRHHGQHVSTDPDRSRVIATGPNTDRQNRDPQPGQPLLLEVTCTGVFDGGDIQIGFVANSEGRTVKFVVEPDQIRTHPTGTPP